MNIPYAIDKEIGKVWDSLEPETQEKIALSTGLDRYRVSRFAPLYTYWRYCLPISKKRLIPAIVRYIEKNQLTDKTLSSRILSSL